MVVAIPGNHFESVAMVTHPAQLLLLNLLGLFVLAAVCGAIYLLYRAYRRRVTIVPTAVRDDTSARATELLVPRERENSRKKYLLATAVALLGLAFGGKYVVALVYGGGRDAQAPMPTGATKIRGASGAELAVTRYGREDKPTLVMTHGWGADSSALLYLVRGLAENYHVVVWDLPGLGHSSAPAKGD